MISFVAAYIQLKLTEGGEVLTQGKLHRLLYYVQAWHLALYDKPLFNGMFQAWIFGPVNRETYDWWAQKKRTLHSLMEPEDIQGFDLTVLTEQAREHIDEVLDVYAPYTGSQLEAMAKREDPWNRARKGYKPSEKCEVEIDERFMGRYYKLQIEPSSSLDELKVRQKQVLELVRALCKNPKALVMLRNAIENVGDPSED